MHFIGRYKLEIGHGFGVVKTVIADDKPKVHTHKSAVIRLAVPLAVQAEDDVAPVPQAGAEVHLLTGMRAGKLMVRRPVTPQPDDDPFGPMIKVIRHISDECTLTADVPPLTGQVVHPVKLHDAAGL